MTVDNKGIEVFPLRSLALQVGNLTVLMLLEPKESQGRMKCQQVGETFLGHTTM